MPSTFRSLGAILQQSVRGNRIDRSTGRYRDNIVIFAHAGY
jgi:hypothetical protein